MLIFSLSNETLLHMCGIRYFLEIFNLSYNVYPSILIISNLSFKAGGILSILLAVNINMTLDKSYSISK